MVFDAEIAVFHLLIEGESVLEARAASAGDEYPQFEGRIGLFADQLACADLVILNKSDLLDPAGRATTRAELAAKLRPAVKLMKCSR